MKLYLVVDCSGYCDSVWSNPEEAEKRAVELGYHAVELVELKDLWSPEPKKTIEEWERKNT